MGRPTGRGGWKGRHGRGWKLWPDGWQMTGMEKARGRLEGGSGRKPDHKGLVSRINEFGIFPSPTFLTLSHPTWSLVTDITQESNRLMGVAGKDRKRELPASLLYSIVQITKQTQMPDHNGIMYTVTI